jgi:chloramphenicol-sensitive protein RarD
MNPGLIYGALAYTAWGLLPIFFKQLSSVPAFEVVMHRTVWALLFLLAVLTYRRHWAWLGAVLRSPRLLGAFALSALLLAVNWCTYIWAVQNGHVLDASLGYFILPLVSVALGYSFLNERPRPGQWLAVAVAGAGVLWLTVQAGRLPWVALVLACTFGFYGLLRKMGALGALEGLTLETLVLSPVAVIALAYLASQGQGALVHAEGHTLAWLLLAGPLTAVPLLLFAAGARRVTLATMGILQYISPTLQLLVGVWLYGEAFEGPRVLGFGLIWSALVVYSLEGWWNRRNSMKLYAK